jgi:hypothetical protein
MVECKLTFHIASYISRMYEGSLCGKWVVILPRDRTKFVELANKRVSRALKAIQLIGNLSNRSSYDYTEEDVSKIFKALEDEMTDCRKRFDRAGKKQGGTLFVLE